MKIDKSYKFRSKCNVWIWCKFKVGLDEFKYDMYENIFLFRMMYLCFNERDIGILFMEEL